MFLYEKCIIQEFFHIIGKLREWFPRRKEKLPLWESTAGTAARTAVFLKAFGINNASTAAEIYQYIFETPGNYLKYFWGYLNFLDLKTVCQKRLGDDFDLKEFHRRILEIGPVQFPVLEKYMK